MTVSLVSQLSLEIKPDLRLGESGENGWFGATLALKGALTVNQNLHRGERLLVSVTKSGGNEIASGLYVVETVGFKAMKDSGVVIGTERMHDANLLLADGAGDDPRNQDAAA